MITIMKIINAVNKMLYQAYPDSDFHIQEIPEGFKRPSFFIDLISDSSKDNNILLTDDKVNIQVVYFAPENEHKIRLKENQLEVYSNIKSLFKKGFVQVEDRAVKIENLEGAPRDNEVYLTIDFSFTEEKPQESQEYDLIGEIKFK